MIKSKIKGGIYNSSCCHAKANNKCMTIYNPDKYYLNITKLDKSDLCEI